MDLRALHRDFGVEVTGFDLCRGGSADQIAALRVAFADHAMLLFCGQGAVSPERQLEIAGWFGPPPPIDNSGNGDLVSVLDNADWAGSARLPFHSDLTYTEDPIAAICLHAIALPSAPTSTTFVSGAAAWDRLDPGMQARLAGLTLRHELESLNIAYNWPKFVATHPLRFVHPRNRRPILFLTEHHAVRIPELTDAESAALIAQLCGELYRPDAQYEHVWEEGDLLIWDNLALQHARTRASDPGEGRRALQRVALANVPLGELVERARAREAAEAS